MFRWYNISQIEPIAVVITISIPSFFKKEGGSLTPPPSVSILAASFAFINYSMTTSTRNYHSEITTKS